MFENIIGNHETIKNLRLELESKSLPQAILFAGPGFTGKLSTALETARILSCEKRGEWTCDCGACRQTKQLLNPYTIMTGWRGFITDIRACSSTLSRVRSTAAQYLFVRSVRKLSRRFDAHLFAADETKRRGIQEGIIRMEELLGECGPEKELPETQKLSKITDEILSCAEKLESFISRDNIPVAQVRNILQWCHETAGAEKKVVIMENAAGMLDSARNALLKILEEPPRDVHFILTATRPDEIIPTIRSRLRKYRFMDRSPGETAEILSRVFKEESSGYSSLKSYFLAWEDINTELTATLAVRFLDRVMSPKPVIIQNEIPELFDRGSPSGLVRYFLEILIEKFREIAHESSCADTHSARQHNEKTLSRIERWTRLLHARNREYNALNISTELFLEHLYLDMREAVLRKFIQRTLEKLAKLDTQSVRVLITQMAAETELLEMVLHSMTYGVLVTDQNNLLILFNKQAERLLPFRGTDLLEKTLWNIIDDAEISQFFREKLTGNENVRDKVFVLGTHVSRTLSISIMPLVKEGTAHGSLVHVEDITEKKTSEARLRRAESLASLTTLAAGVAHEIKNPLGSIGIHLQLAQKEMKEKETIRTDTITGYLGVVAEEVDRLNRIVVDFLFAVRPMNIQLEETDINLVIRELTEFLKFELKEAGVEFELALAEKLPKLMIDEKYFKQALLNLIQNSISAMHGGGKLILETVRKGSDVLCRISDSGTGIPEDIMDKIFEPYFTTKEFGSGLGLTLVYKIVKEHNAEISVVSREAKGTTFTITLSIPQPDKKLISYGGEEE